MVHWLPPDDTPPGDGGIHLLDTRVHRLQSVQPLLEQRAQPLVSLHGIHEQRVTSRLRLVQDVQECGARRLGLVGDV